MPYCSNCGEEVPDDVKFCIYCGARIDIKERKAEQVPVQPQPQVKPQPTTPYEKKEPPVHKKQKSHRVLAIVLIFIIVAAVSAFGLIALVMMENIDDTNYYYYNPTSPSSVEKFEIYIDTGSIDVRFTNVATAPVASIKLDFRYFGPAVEGQGIEDFFNIYWRNTTDVKLFSVTHKIESWIFFGLREHRITVTLRKGVNFRLNGTTNTGSASAIIPNGASIDDLILYTNTGSIDFSATGSTFSKDIQLTANTGSIDADLTDCVVGGDIIVQTNTGSIDFDSTDIRHTQNSDWTISANTGSVDINIVQSKTLGADVSAAVSANTGSIRVDFEGEESLVCAKFGASTSTGGIDFDDRGGFSESGDTFTSDNYPAGYNFDFTLITITGSIDVDAENS